MILSLMSSEQLCIYILKFQYYGHFVELPWFPSFRFWSEEFKMKTRKSQAMFIFWVYKAQINVVDRFWSQF